MASDLKSFNPNKLLKEQFVSNLTGSSKLELFLLISTVSGVVLIRRALGCHDLIGYNASEASKKNDGEIVRNNRLRAFTVAVTVDFFFVLVPFVLILTVLSGWIYLNATLVILSLLILFSSGRIGSLSYQEGVAHSFRRNVSSYRVYMMLLTCLCILAVDFKIFPRRYAKTETYGTSLMDVGVGSFVLANSLVSRQARGTIVRSLRNVVSSCSPLIFLGFARLISTSGVDYQVHVGEYGVHWNFFFTLAGVAILTSLINVPPKYCGLLGFSVLAGYQFCLSLGLSEYLLSNDRGTSVISQNKEGIYSMFGYWGLYLIGVQLGNHLLFGNHDNANSRVSYWARIRVLIFCLLFWSLTLFLDQFVERISRRTCNLAYVTLVLALNLQVVAIVSLSDFIPGSRMSLLEESFNQNLLATFLLANLLTGLVNLSINTLFTSSTTALAILLGYALTLCISLGFLHYYGIKLKFR